MLGRHLAPGGLGEAAVAEAAHGGRVGGQPADGLGQARVVAERAAVAVGTPGQRAPGPCSVRSIFDTFMIQSIPRSWRSDPWLTAQPWLQLAEQVLLRAPPRR